MLRIKIYLDDNIDRDILIAILRKEGFEAISPRNIGMMGKNDNEHLKCAVLNNAVVLTSDEEFPEPNPHIKHSGILKIYKYNDPRKDMSYNKIVRALKNIEKLGLVLANKEYKLNDFNY